MGDQNFDLQKQIISEVQKLLKSSNGMDAPLIAKLIMDLYPSDFEIRDCPVCKTKDWVFDFAGTTTLPAELYQGTPEFPIYARGALPLIYGHCRTCGGGQVVVAPKSHWIDPTIALEGNFGAWMEDSSYIEDKLIHSRLHYKKSNLEQFKSDSPKVLEVSPGSGVFLKTLRDEFGWKNVQGVEPDPCAAYIAKTKYDLPVINDYIYHVRNQANYDLVIFDNSLEHHSDPASALTAARDFLRPDGGLYIVVPNYHSYAVEKLKTAYCNLNWGHWSYFTMQNLHALVTKANFKVLAGYSFYFESSMKSQYNQAPSDVDTFLNGEEIAQLKSEDKAFRGEYLHLIAKKI